MKIQLSFLILSLIFIFSCKESNFITIMDEGGKMTEKYKINSDSLKHGPYSAYVDGVLSEEANYENGKLHGIRTIFHANGKPEIVETYDNDRIVGTYKTFFDTGILSQEATYINGMMQGDLKTYYKGGELKEVVTMQNNEENGPFKEYYESGNLKWEGQFLNGDNEFGLLKNYNEEGELVKKMMCDSLGVCTTIWTSENGDIAPKN